MLETIVALCMMIKHTVQNDLKEMDILHKYAQNPKLQET